MAARRRAMAALLAGAVLMNAAMAAASAVSTIVAGGVLGPAWGGIPTCAAIGGTGLGAVILTRVMQARGRRAAFITGYAAAGLGGLITAMSAAHREIAALTGGMLLLGLGNAAVQLSRYAAAEMYPPHRRAAAISALLWAVTVGAVGGPLLLAPSGSVTAMLGGLGSSGPFLFAMLAAWAAAIAAACLPKPRASGAAWPARLRELSGLPAARPALVVMVTAQVVMVAVMTATPLAMHMTGQGLDAVGMVLSAHTFGMFALSPLTGWLADRFGPRPVMLVGLATMAAATTLAAAAGELAWLHTTALSLLGYGWNLCFVAGSADLARDLPPLERARIEGAVDSGVWAAAALASLASTVLMAAAGYPGLAGAAGILAVLPALTLTRRRARTVG